MRVEEAVLIVYVGRFGRELGRSGEHGSGKEVFPVVGGYGEPFEPWNGGSGRWAYQEMNM